MLLCDKRERIISLCAKLRYISAYVQGVVLSEFSLKLFLYFYSCNTFVFEANIIERLPISVHCTAWVYMWLLVLCFSLSWLLCLALLKVLDIPQYVKSKTCRGKRQALLLPFPSLPPPPSVMSSLSSRLSCLSLQEDVFDQWQIMACHIDQIYYLFICIHVLIYI